jgi:peptidoglycan/LPS O-acetylase OafA/YrhL
MKEECFSAPLPLQHTLENTGTTAITNVTESVITIGHEAVMVFFVLSGFLVGGGVLNLMSRDAWFWRDYLIKRLTRLWIVLTSALFFRFAPDLGGSYLFSGSASIYSSPAGQPYVGTSNLWTLYRPTIVLGNIGVSAGHISAYGGNQPGIVESCN